MMCFSNNNPDFYIQTKGMNAGKPLKNPIPNSIGIIADRKKLIPEYLFFVVHYLHSIDAFKPFINGVAIPFITHKNISTVINNHFFKS